MKRKCLLWRFLGALACVQALAMMPAAAVAVGLGDLTVESHLGEPFRGELTVVLDGLTDLDAIRLSEAGARDYRRMEVVASGYTFLFDREAAVRDGAVLRVPVRADRPMQDLFIDLVVVLDEGRMRQIRHYPVLLDPPPAARLAAAPTASTSAPRPAARAPATPPAPRPGAGTGARSPGTAASADGPRPGEGRWRVGAGQTLSEIAGRVAPAGETRATAEAILALNPEAFIDGDADRLMAGVTLTLPEGAQSPPAGREAAPPAGAAPGSPRPDSLVSGATGRTLRRAAESDRVRLRAPPETEEVVERLAGWIGASDEALVAGGRAMRRDIAYARTEITTFRNENDNLRERIDLLEGRIAQLRRLIDLRETGAAAGGGRGADATAVAADPAAAREAPRPDPFPEPEPESETVRAPTVVASTAPPPAARDEPPIAVSGAAPSSTGPGEAPADDTAGLWLVGIGSAAAAGALVLVGLRRFRRRVRAPAVRPPHGRERPTLLPDDL